MNAPDLAQSPQSVVDLLRGVRKKGVELWSDRGQLRYKAGKGALTEREISMLRAHRPQIIELLEGHEIHGAAADAQERLDIDFAPASFSQYAHWKLYGLGQRPAIRQIVSANKLTGCLHVERLKRSLEQIVCFHGALRTRLVVHGGELTQEILTDSSIELELEDLSNVPAERLETEIDRRIAKAVLEPCDVAVGPLVAVKLLKLGNLTHVLIVAMEHAISDAYSMTIFLRDVFKLYAATQASSRTQTFDKPRQFADFALWQRRDALRWYHRATRYAQQNLDGASRLTLRSDEVGDPDLPLGMGVVPIRIEPDLKRELLAWCRRTRTTVAMAVFTTFVAVLLRMCRSGGGVVRYVIDGRLSEEWLDTIGYFACTLHLRVELRNTDTFLDLLRRVLSSYCLAYENADYSCLESQDPALSFLHSPCLNWVPYQPRVNAALEELDSPIRVMPLPFRHPMLESADSREDEPVILLYESEHEIAGGVHFARGQFSEEAMRRLAENFMVLLLALVRHPEQLVCHVNLA